MPPSCLISPFSFKAKPFEDLPTLALSISSALVLTASSNQASASPILLIKVIYYLYTAKARDQFPGLALLYFTAASDTGNHFSPKVFFFSQILHHHTHLVSLCLWRFLTPSADSPSCGLDQFCSRPAAKWLPGISLCFSPLMNPFPGLHI